jgi:hypothetical protein
MGGMGGMGGGMGGMGGGMGGMGGMGGRGMMSGTMPASMGMMMLGRLVMYLCGDYDSWDQRSLMIGMMGMRGMGGMGMGGMGMGGMGGMRSVPATGPPETTLEPHQDRHLPTTVVSMNGPNANSLPQVPAEGEKLRISGVDQWTDDERTLTALKRLAEAKAPQTIAQMVLWYVTGGADWDDIGRLSQGWGNASEIALAKRFVSELSPDEKRPSQPWSDPGLLCWEIKEVGAGQPDLVDGVRTLWSQHPVLGLTAREGIPEHPNGPSLACRVELTDAAINVKLSASHPSGSDWVLIDRFHLKRSEAEPAAEHIATETPLTGKQERLRQSFQLADSIAAAMVEHLVRITVVRGPRIHDKESFRIKIINDSQFILNGLAVGGPRTGDDRLPSVLAGLSLPPLKSLTVPASGEAVRRLRLKEGARVVAADLSGL